MKKQLLSQKRHTQLLSSLVIFLLCMNVGWGQTTVYHETFGTATAANVYTGGTSTVPSSPEATYAVSYSPAKTSNGSSQVVLASGDGYLYMTQVSSGNGKTFISTSMPAGLNSQLKLNTGKITWTFNLRTSNTSTMASTYADNSRWGGVILCGSNADAFAASGAPTGYAVIMGKVGSNANNSVRLVRMTNGFNATASTSNTPVLLESAQLSANTNYQSVKVIYDPAADTFAMSIRDDGTSAFTDPTTGGAFTLVGTSASETTYTSTVMTHHGYVSANSATTSGLFYDNYKITLTPATTPTITSGTALTTFSYEGAGPSAVQSTVITGANLTGPITIDATALSKYELSKDNFVSVESTNFTFTSGSTLYVRLKAGLTTGAQDETINVVSTSDSFTLPINCTGSVIGSYTYNGSGSLTTPSNWTPVPSSMSEAGAKFFITGNVTTDAAWSLGTGAKIYVGDASSAASLLTIANGAAITGSGTIDLPIAATGTNSLTIQSASYPTLGVLHNTSTVHLQIQPSANISSNISFGNLILDGADMQIGGSSNSLNGTITINGTLTIDNGVTLSGNSTNYNVIYFNSGAKAVINGKFKHSRATGLVTFGAAMVTGNHVPALQFADAEIAGVNFILGPDSTVEFSRGGSSTSQEITARSDYKNLKISDGSSSLANKIVSGTVNVSGTLTLNHIFASTITGAGSFVLGNAASIVRTSGSFGTAVPITFGTSVNVTYDGTTAITSGAEIPTSTSVLNNLEIDNVAGVTLASATAVNNKLILTAGNLATSSLLTLKSTASKTAVVAPVVGTISGNVTTERYIPSGHRAYRLLSPATTGGTIKTNWQENQADGADVNVGYGTHITGAGGSINGFDTTTSNQASVFIHNNSSPAWTALANTSENLTAGNPYLVYVRGSRQASNISSTSNDATTLRTTGTLKTGDVVVSGLNAMANGFSVVGNPYQAQVDMQAVLASATNLNTAFYYVVDPSLGTKGGYLTVDVTDAATSHISKYLQAGQACFVNTLTDAPASLTFTEANKSTAEAQTSIFKTRNATTPSLNITLLDAAANRLDVLKVAFDASESNAVNQNDAIKLGNFDESMATSNGGVLLAIEKRALPTATDVIPLNITKYRGTSYTLKVQGSGLTETPYLVDNFTTTTTEIPVNGTLDYAYTVDAANVATTDASRFKLIYAKTLGTNTNTIAGFALYPNPSKSNSFNVVVPQSSSKASITVSNLLGQKIFSQSDLNSGATAITVSNAKAAGIYLVSLNLDGKTATTKWIVE